MSESYSSSYSPSVPIFRFPEMEQTGGPKQHNFSSKKTASNTRILKSIIYRKCISMRKSSVPQPSADRAENAHLNCRSVPVRSLFVCPQIFFVGFSKLHTTDGHFVSSKCFLFQTSNFSRARKKGKYSKCPSLYLTIQKFNQTA